MSEISESIINGECCALCGCYFYESVLGEPTPYKHGYPVACYECFSKDCGYQKATVETF